MNQKIRTYLIELSRKKGIIHYQELCDICGLKLNMRDNPSDRAEIGRILGEISFYEYHRGRPLLSSIVLSKNMEEGDGFYKLCEELGYGDWKRLKRNDAFAYERMNECYEYWSNSDNYENYANISV